MQVCLPVPLLVGFIIQMCKSVLLVSSVGSVCKVRNKHPHDTTTMLFPGHHTGACTNAKQLCQSQQARMGTETGQQRHLDSICMHAQPTEPTDIASALDDIGQQEGASLCHGEHPTAAVQAPPPPPPAEAAEGLGSGCCTYSSSRGICCCRIGSIAAAAAVTTPAAEHAHIIHCTSRGIWCSCWLESAHSTTAAGCQQWHAQATVSNGALREYWIARDICVDIHAGIWPVAGAFCKTVGHAHAAAAAHAWHAVGAAM